MAEDAQENKSNDTVGLFLRAMVDREPGKRKVKPSKAALIDLAELDLGESSDDSDFNVDEAKLKEDDDISINSDPDACDDDDFEDEDDDDEINEKHKNNYQEEDVHDNTPPSKIQNGEYTVAELLLRAKQKQLFGSEKNAMQTKILVCAICLGDYSDDTNEIVICDGCHVSVHEGCYGISDTISISSTVSSSSTEPWFCDSCKAGVNNPPCELCPNLGHTIFKETEMGRWVHLVCALYIPGIAFSEVDKLSFPTLFEMPYSRWGAKTCSLCEDERYSKTGVCIGCDAGMCRAYFHVTCAQREGLLSEVNHGEADQADPYYAHCKLHSDRELIRRRKRNWLALQLRMKKGEIDKLNISQETQNRLDRKMLKYKEKYMFTKSNRPTPWFPTQKMPRSISTCASLFRTLLHKTKLMGLETETALDTPTIGDIRKKWHIPPAFNIEFISYYLDRNSRLQEMKSRLEFLLKENEQLVSEESDLREKYNNIEKENKELSEENQNLLSESLELHDVLKSLAGRPLRLPSVVAAMQPPFVGVDTSPTGRVGSVGKGKKVITKAAAKMMGDSTDLSNNSMQRNSPSFKQNSNKNVSSTATTPFGSSKNDNLINLNKCRICQFMRDQHLLIQCDTCSNYYHLSCLDPPLTRMPKKTKQMGWQCSDCCKSSDSDKAPEIDTAAPRRLRRIIKEPAKFSPSVAADQKSVHERTTDLTGHSQSEAVKIDTSSTGSQAKVKAKAEGKSTGMKRRVSSEPKKGKKQKVKNVNDTSKENTVATVKLLKGTHVLKECSLKVEPLQNIDRTTVLKSKGKEKSESLPKSPPTPDKLVRRKSSIQDSSSCLNKGETSETGSSLKKKTAIDYSKEVNITVNQVTTDEAKEQKFNAELSVENKRTEKKESEDSFKFDEKENLVKLSDANVVLKDVKAEPKLYSKENEIVGPPSNPQKPIKTEELKADTKKQPIIPSKTITLDVKQLKGDKFPVKTPAVFKDSKEKCNLIANIKNESCNPSCPSDSNTSQAHTSSPPVTKSAANEGICNNKSTNSNGGSSTNVQSVGNLGSSDNVVRSSGNHSLDVSAESLPSASSLHSPHSESFHSAEDDPLSPRKEKRHRDGSKKKKKDKEKEGEGGRKRKKHHHRDRHSLAEITSEMVSPFRIKIKSLPPPPPPPSSEFSSIEEQIAMQHTTSTTTAPPGYPPLPPGYTLTQPMLISSSASMNAETATSLSTSAASPKCSQLPSVTVITTGATTVSSLGLGANKSQQGRRKSDPTGEQFSKCDVCGEMGGVTNTVTCDECLKAYHFNCLEPPLKKSPKRRGYSWFCEDCDNAATNQKDARP